MPQNSYSTMAAVEYGDRTPPEQPPVYESMPFLHQNGGSGNSDRSSLPMLPQLPVADAQPEQFSDPPMVHEGRLAHSDAGAPVDHDAELRQVSLAVGLHSLLPRLEKI